MSHLQPADQAPAKGAYRTSSGYQIDERRLRLRGGSLDGQSCVRVVAVGARAFCGEGEWGVAGVYLVTAEEIVDEQGRTENVAVPAFA